MENFQPKKEVQSRTFFRVSGILWLAAVIFVFISLIIVIRNDITLNPEDMVKTLNGVNTHALAHIIELIFDVLSDVAIILLAATLYLAFSDFSRTKALIGSLLLAVGGTILIVHDMGNFAVTWIAKDFVTAAGSQAVILETVARAMLLTAKWGVTLGSNLFVAGVLFYSMILVSHRELSKVVGWFGIISGVLAFAATIPGWISFSLEQVGYNMYLPFMVWEIVFGIWLLRKKIEW